MKKVIRYFVLLVVLFIPSFVNAYEIKCDGSSHKYGSPFTCSIDGISIGYEYKEISGTLTIPDTLSCNVSSTDEGLTNKEGDSLTFNLSGKATSTRAITYTCRINKKITKDSTEQIVINNLVVQDSTMESKPMPEILRSSMLTLNKYVETTEVEVTKPRDVTNGNSLLKEVKFDKTVKNTEGNNFVFSKYITEYPSLQVTYDIKDITLTYVPNVSNAIVKVVSETNDLEITDNSVYTELAIGDNIIDIDVTSADGVAHTVYTFYLKRVDKGEGLYNKNEDATLSDLVLSGYKINFKSDVYKYQIDVPSDVTSIGVNAVSTVNGASVVVRGNTNIKNGSNIVVEVTSVDKKHTNKYIINVKKKANYDLIVQYVVLAIGAIGIIVVVVQIIKSLNKKRANDPIYKLKMKRKINNAGAKLDETSIPVVGGTTQPSTPIQPQAVQQQPVQPQVQVQPQVVQQQPVQPQVQVQPQVVQQQPVQPQVQVQPQVVQPNTVTTVNPQIVNNGSNNGSNLQ